MSKILNDEAIKGLVKDAVESFVPDENKKAAIFNEIKKKLPPLSMDDARSKKQAEHNSAVLTADGANSGKSYEKAPLSMDDARSMKNMSRAQMAEARFGDISPKYNDNTKDAGLEK